MNFDALDQMFRAMDSQEALEAMEAAPTIVEAAEIMLAHITKNAPGFDPASLSSARQWCRSMFYHGAAEGTRRTHAVRDRQSEQLREALVQIEEYWNGASGSAVDAAEEMRFRAQQAIEQLGNSE
jgi:hypothetical protein